jgi:hypothetical protein
MLRISGGIRVNNSAPGFPAGWLKQLHGAGAGLGQHILKTVQDSTFGVKLESIVLIRGVHWSLLLAMG